MKHDNPKPVSEGGEVSDAIAQLRTDLEAFDKLLCTVHPDSTDEEWKPFMSAQDKLYDNPDEKYHMLFDEIASLESDNANLKARLLAAEGLREALEPFAGAYLAWIERPDILAFFPKWIQSYLNMMGMTTNIRHWFEQAAAALTSWHRASGEQEAGA